ncbi:MAG: hypothetical protein IPP72_13625 [Chitinophagaceae bacterium]|nr:hypothetical protein [Chitinophagaceae bacterium]
MALSTGATATGGTVAPVGFTRSEVQPGKLMPVLPTVLPTDFLWRITYRSQRPVMVSSQFTAYAYSTGYAGATSPYAVIRVQIFNTNPSIGSPAHFGDLTTNRFSASSTASMYCIFNATPRRQPVRSWKNQPTTVNTVLPSGSYWIEWQLDNGLAKAISHPLKL